MLFLPSPIENQISFIHSYRMIHNIYSSQTEHWASTQHTYTHRNDRQYIRYFLFYLLRWIKDNTIWRHIGVRHNDDIHTYIHVYIHPTHTVWVSTLTIKGFCHIYPISLSRARCLPFSSFRLRFQQLHKSQSQLCLLWKPRTTYTWCGALCRVLWFFVCGSLMLELCVLWMFI